MGDVAHVARCGRRATLARLEVIRLAITTEYDDGIPPRIEPPMPPGVKVRLINHVGQVVATFQDREAFMEWRQLQHGRRQRSDSER